MGYFKATLSGVSWSAAERWVIRGTTFIRVAILARILVPAQFGVFGIATLTLGLLEVFTETAINFFLVQEKGSIDHYVDTAWVISICRGLAIGGVLFISAPIVSAFYRAPDSQSILYLISLVPVIRGFINPSIIKLQKELLFNQEFQVRTLLFLIDSLTSITLAIVLKSPASLVFGMLVSAVFEVFLSWLLFKPRPRLAYLPEKAATILHRGKWITAAGIFSYLYQNGDNMVVGRMLGETSLGYYDYAYKISGTPVSEVSDVVARVSFPVYVQINQDRERLKKAFIKTTLSVCSVSTLIGLSLFIFARPVVLIVLGARWVPAIPALRVLSLCGVAKSITGSVYPLLLAAKRNDYITWITLTGVIGMAVSIVPLVSWWGIVGAGVAAIIGAFSSLPLAIIFAYRILRSKA